MTLVYILLALVALYAIRILRDFIKRYKLMCVLKKLEEEVGGKLTRHKNPYRSIFKLSPETEITFESEDTAYHIRLISSFGFYKRIVHFASPEYLVSFRRFKFVLLRGYSFVGASHSFTHSDGFNYGCKVRILPPHKHVMTVDGKKNVDVFLFSPTPHTVSYVTPEKTSIRMARIDAEIYGNRVFTASTFREHLLTAHRLQTAPPPTYTYTPITTVEEPLREYASFRPSDFDLPKEEKQPPAPFSPEELGSRLKLQARRYLFILGIIELLIIAFTLVSFFAFNRNGTLLFIALVLFIANFIAGKVINSRLHLFSKFSKTYEATVTNKITYTPIRHNGKKNYQHKVYHVYPEGYLGNGESSIMDAPFLLVVTESGRTKHKIALATSKHNDIFVYGDRIIKYAGLPYPFIISRRARNVACPACGNITDGKAEGCPECGCTFPESRLSEKD